MLGLIATMSIVGAISAFAITIDFSDTNAVGLTGEKLDGVEFNGLISTEFPVHSISNENMQYMVKRDSISSNGDLKYVHYGYIENGKFIPTKTWVDAYFKFENVFDSEQLSKDKAAGIANDRVYAITILWWDGETVSWAGDEQSSWSIWAFQLTDGNSNNTTNSDDNDSDSSYISGWKQDNTGWWYQYSDGSYIKSTWFQDADGTWYYFSADGYMLANTTTPDGYYVNASGIWVQ